MALTLARFDHTNAPVLANGCLLGATGISLTPGGTLGSLVAVSSSDGSFNEVNGYGQADSDSAGNAYIATENKVQRFIKNASGAWVYDSKCINMGTLLGGGVNCSLLAIDRTVTPNQIHIGNWDHYTATNWISVWPITAWPNLTTGNRLRQYGANNSVNTAGRALQGLGLTIDSQYAVVTSIGSPFRLLRWDHVSGILQNEETQAAVYSRFVTDGAGNWWVVGSTAAAEPGLWKINPATFTGISRLDNSGIVALTIRRNRHWQTLFGNAFYAAGRVYLKDYTGRVWGLDAATGTYVDTFLDPGSLETNDQFAGKIGSYYNGALFSKPNVVTGPTGCQEAWIWSHNADNGNTQSFITYFPMTTGTCTWTKTNWSAGVSTLKRLAVQGLHLASEKAKIRLRKNAGAWVTVLFSQLCDEALLASVGTFTSGDTLTIELSMSIWDRVDGQANLVSTRDKLAPQNVILDLVYDDSLADVYVPYASGAFKVKFTGTGAFKVKIGA